MKELTKAIVSLLTASLVVMLMNSTIETTVTEVNYLGVTETKKVNGWIHHNSPYYCNKYGVLYEKVNKGSTVVIDSSDKIVKCKGLK